MDLWRQYKRIQYGGCVLGLLLEARIRRGGDAVGGVRVTPIGTRCTLTAALSTC